MGWVGPVDAPGGVRAAPDALLFASLIVESPVRVTKVEVLRKAAHGLGIPEEEESARHETARDPSDHLPRRFGREVHQDVSTEDDVERSGAPERRILDDEIPLLERHGRADAGLQDQLAALGAELAGLDLNRPLA